MRAAGRGRVDLCEARDRVAGFGLAARGDVDLCVLAVEDRGELEADARVAAGYDEDLCRRR